MSVILGPDWSAAAEAIIRESLVRLSLYVTQARSVGSRLMTDSFLENAMIQKLDHRSGLFSFRPPNCHGAVGLCRRQCPKR